MRLHPLNIFVWKSSLAGRIALVLAGGLLGTAMTLDPLIACGPYFPNSILLQGDAAVLQAPQAKFCSELGRLKWEGPRGLVAAEASESVRQGTVDAEIQDLRRALGSIVDPTPTTNEIADWVLAYSRKRADVEDHRHAQVQRTPSEPAADGELRRGDVAADSPVFAIEWGDLPSAIPQEFRIYLEGAAAWHDDRPGDARDCWERLLSLPAKDRRYKSTWAAYMIGRSWHDQEPERAADYYQRTRRAARDGLVDSAGLAVASLGWEAQLRFRAKDYSDAMRLYLDEYAAGSTQTSAQSLGLVADALLEEAPEVRLVVARDKTLRRVITAWLLSQASTPLALFDEASGRPVGGGAWGWLETIEASGAGEVELAEQLALLAYQTGQWSVAERWVDLSGDSTTARWVRAKLWLREGRLEEAASELSQVVRALPVDSAADAKPRDSTLAESLFTGSDEVPSGCEVHGELGTLRLSQGDFVQALDLLARGGFWQDAAYVAERVLTVDELKSYVDRSWPGPSTNGPKRKRTDGVDSHPAEPELLAADLNGERLRHLLGRRLTRLNRGREATPYFPEKWRGEHRRLLTLLATGENPQLDVRERARAWYAAAWLTRTNGLELLGTEVAPDWAIWDGSYEQGPTHEERQRMESRWLKPQAAEGARANRHAADPEVRFHYRYHAALLAWSAAALLPDHEDETARILYDAGCWLKARDPQTADLFYKTLVRRCRRTQLGDAADRQRWFPDLDAAGTPIVTRRVPGLTHPADLAAPAPEVPMLDSLAEDSESSSHEAISDPANELDAEPLAPGPDLE